MTIILVAQPINERIQTAVDKNQKREDMVQFGIQPCFSRHCQRVVRLTWREANDQHNAGGADHPRHFPAHFSPALS